MATFHPPLGHTALVQIPLHTQDVTFATFSADEASNGSWEIWTDLPNVDDRCQRTTEDGEWRAIPFLPLASQPMNGVADVNGHVISIPTVKVSSSSSRESTVNESKTL